jgi:hypothetical protein
VIASGFERFKTRIEEKPEQTVVSPEYRNEVERPVRIDGDKKTVRDQESK